jgi:hypothetical protein
VATSSILTDRQDRRAARIAIVEQHVRLENAHDLEGVLGTFGDTARYDDEPWGEHFNGRDGVRQFYEQLMKALPDLQIEIQRRHAGDDAIILEVMIRGTQLGAWPVSRRLAGGWSSHFAVSTHSTPITVWPEKKSTTTAGRYCANSASSTNRQVY